MNIVESYARMMDVPDRETGIKLLKKIEWCARVSHRSEDAQTEDSWERVLRSIVINHGDWSVVEHSGVTVDAVVDRGISHEWVRHRIFSFTQESTRFVNYEKKMPPSFVKPNGMSHNSENAWEVAIAGIEMAYKVMISEGCAPQIARSVFPNSLSTRIVTTGNLRNWRHFFLMRTTKETHPQMREVSIPLLAEFKEKIPLVYDDITPMATQRENLRLPR